MFSPQGAPVAPQAQTCWSERIQIEPGALPFGPAVDNGVHLVSLELDHNRLEKMLRCGVAVSGVLRFEPFVQDALVRGVHVDEYQAVAVLREDVDSVQLRQGGAERLMLRRPGRFRAWALPAPSQVATHGRCQLQPKGCAMARNGMARNALAHKEAMLRKHYHRHQGQCGYPLRARP